MGRPGEGLDPYDEDSRFSRVVEAFCHNDGQGLWVPAQGRDDMGVVSRSHSRRNVL